MSVSQWHKHVASGTSSRKKSFSEFSGYLPTQDTFPRSTSRSQGIDWLTFDGNDDIREFSDVSGPPLLGTALLCHSPSPTKRIHVESAIPRTPSSAALGFSAVSPVRSAPEIPRDLIKMSIITHTHIEDSRQVVDLDNGNQVVLGTDRSRSNFGKELVPAIVRANGLEIAAVGVISDDPPLSLGAHPDHLGVLDTFKLPDGKTVQLLRRGVPISTLIKWLKSRSEPNIVKLGLMLRHIQSTIPVLTQLHGSGFAHMDIKPGNLVAYRDGSGMIDIDRLPRIGSNDPYASDRGFSSPAPVRIASTASDVYSLGGVLRDIRNAFSIKNHPIRQLFDTLIETTRSTDRRDRPGLSRVADDIRAIQDQIAHGTDVDPLHEAFLQAHDHVFNVANPEFFKALFDAAAKATTWSSSW